METEIERKAVPVSITEATTLETKLRAMDKDGLIDYADNVMGLTVDRRLGEEKIIDQLLAVDTDVKIEAAKVTAESTKIASDDSDPVVDCVFHRFDFPEADLEFAYTGTRGFKGPNNPKGFSKAPRYHLFPGETCSIPFTVKEHLEKLKFVDWKTVIDEKTGTVKDRVPIEKQKYVLELKMTKEQIINSRK